jgi:hypothetical protein
MTVGRGVESQVAAFKDGFNCVFSIQDLTGFRSEELVRLFGSGDEDWSYESKLSITDIILIGWIQRALNLYFFVP